MRKLISAAGLQILAVWLAFLQWHVGVRTDEAKYLLNIPYPHPPGTRFVLSLLKGWEFQEIFWRLIFATLLIQAVWLVWDLARDLSRNQRLVVAVSWVLSSAVLLQAGTVMMAPLTALQALVILWLQSRPDLAKRHATAAGFFWLWSVFTAYQSVLFAPLTWMLFRDQPLWKRLCYLGIPLLLLCLYTLSNPLAAASFVVHGGRQVSEGIGTRLFETVRVWALAGSVILSITGTIGMIRSKRWDLLLSFLLVAAYIALSRFDYYAILFVPLLVTGFSRFFDPHCKTAPWFEVPVWTLLLAAGCLGMFQFHGLPPPSKTRALVQSLNLKGTGLLLISGSYGHEWQYESPVVVRKFTPGLVSQAQAIVCLQACPAFDHTGLRQSSTKPDVWLR